MTRDRLFTMAGALACLAVCLAQEQVSTPAGPLRGSTMTSWSGRQFLAFRGVPYAKPPLGQLRFKGPARLERWEGVRNASEDAPACSQPSPEYIAPVSEDCLYLNVYSHSLRGDRPVIVFFHPGGFYSLSGRSDWLGPEYLLDRDVVLVLANYRLGPLGFLSTGDGEAPGNYGLKDQLAVLEWVRDNIGHFGGAPGRVTLAGYSAGAASVFLHLVSPRSTGLFSKGIAMSGGLSSWAVDKEPLERARRLGRLVGCEQRDSRGLVGCLRDKPAQLLADQFPTMTEWGDDPLVQFGPVIERPGPSSLLTVDPTAALASGQFHQVPLVAGITTNEFEARSFNVAEMNLMGDLDQKFAEVAPIAFMYERGSPRSRHISSRLRNYYFGSGRISNSSVGPLGRLYADSLIIFGVERAAKLAARTSKLPVYFYQFDYLGRFGHGHKPGSDSPYGVAHHDDLLYLFQVRKAFPAFNQTDPEASVVRIMTSFWTNFASTGDPTPSGQRKWLPLAQGDLRHLVMSNHTAMKAGLPFKKRMAQWEALFPVQHS